MIATILESKPVRAFQEWPLAAKVLVIASLAAAIFACVYLYHGKLSASVGFFTSSGVMGASEIIRKLFTPKEKTEPDEPRYSIHGYVPEKLCKQLKCALSQPRSYDLQAPFQPLSITTPLSGPLKSKELSLSVSAAAADTASLVSKTYASHFSHVFNKQPLHFDVTGLFEGDESYHASAYVKEHLIPLLKQNLPQSGWGLSDRILCNALTKTCVALNKNFIETGNVGWTNALFTLKYGSKLYIVNVGNSSAYLAKPACGYFLTEEARADDDRFTHSYHKQDISLPNFPTLRTIGNPEGLELSARPKITVINQADRADEPSQGKLYYAEGDLLVLANASFWQVIDPEHLQEALHDLQDHTHKDMAAHLLNLARKNGAADPLTVVIQKL